jgi:hypothetical protein
VVSKGRGRKCGRKGREGKEGRYRADRKVNWSKVLLLIWIMDVKSLGRK